MNNKILILNDFNIVNSSQVIRFYAYEFGDIHIFCNYVNDEPDAFGVEVYKTDSKDKAIDILIKIVEKIASAPDGSIVDLRTI